LPEKTSIALLPFQNVSGDPEQEYFADGMVEEIITALSRSKSVRFGQKSNSSPVTTVKPHAVAEKDWGATQRGRTATFVTLPANNNALQFAARSGYRVIQSPVGNRG
jgi:TolB-like protein